jgi:predicted metal-dependent HD superfamily phosphohydrolase
MSRPAPHARNSDLVRDSLLEERFARLWRRCLVPGASSDAGVIWSLLAQQYSEPHRFYHDREHLAHCLDELDLAASLVGHPDQVEMAIWFHDVINEPGARDNEERSAEYFRRLAGNLFDKEFIDAVADLILVTTHREAPSLPDQRFICDIDLTSFGCPWECFLRDSSAVKAEFTGTEEEYYRGKEAFLRAMLGRSRIFLTDFFNQRYELQARENIGRLLQMIEKRID